MQTIISSIFVLLFSVSVSAQWTWQNPLPQGNTLNDVFFITNTIGWAVGDAGTILKSVDGGASFEVINYPFHQNLYAVEFNDMQNGVCVGESGIMLKSSDGGNTWNSKETGLTENLRAISMISPGKVWATGDDGTILHSDDSGDTWQVQWSDTSMSLSSVSFVDATHGWAAGGNNSGGSVLLHTTNGGLTWTELSGGLLSPFSVVQFIDTYTGFAILPSSPYGGGESVYKTIDCGHTWTFLSTPGWNSIFDIYFIDADHGWVVGWIGDTGQFSISSYTNDGGNTWTEIWGGRGTLMSIFIKGLNDPFNGWVVGSGGQIYHITSDGGVYSLNTICEGATYGGFYDVFFTDENHGWAVGGNFYPSRSKILRTDNGGATWNATETFGNPLKKVFFVNSQEGWIIGTPGAGPWSNVVMHTTDGGLSWETQYYHYGNDSEPSFKDLWFTDQQMGWVVGGTDNVYPPPDTTILLHTTDGGLNWINLSNLTDKTLSAVCFTDPNNGWIAGDQTILHTSDGGQNWEEIWTGIHNWTDITFLDHNHGWVLGDSIANWDAKTMIMRTSDGGSTWEESYLDHHSYGKEIFFTDMDHGWIANGELLSTNDGGETWKQQLINFESSAGVSFVDNSNGWVVGGAGDILHTTNGGMVGIKDPPPILKTENFGVDIYPNPSIGQFTVEFYLQQSSMVNLVVHNSLGQVVATLTDGVLAKGTHQVLWNTGNLPAGIFYCRLQAGEHMVSNKILKIQ